MEKENVDSQLGMAWASGASGCSGYSSTDIALAPAGNVKDTTKQNHQKDELLVTVGNVKEESLQERFLRFKKERQRERALANKSLNARTTGIRDVERLRKRFVETCKGYIGVPYGRKHHDPDEPDYNAPLFLDCCGLVRRAVQDLQEDFGFRIGRWNQAYQFESLPKVISFEDAKPGDLVFVEGVYNDEQRAPQRHNIVHVEVFIGGETGEATIGSRWSKSVPEEDKVRGVQIHTSYKYFSKKYEIKAYHFRSLDTWLHGTCRSTSYADSATTADHCASKSIFDEGASDDDEEDTGTFTPDAYRESPVFYVGEGNNWKVVAQALEDRGWRRLPFDAGFSSKFDLKWVEQRGKIDYKRHIEGQFVNHIPNNDVITSKMRFLCTMRAHEELTGERFQYHPVSYISERAGEKLAALAEAEAAPEALWILKPSRGLGGKGIEIVKGVEELRQKLFPPPRDLAEDAPKAPPPVEGWVVQKYIQNPLLLQGRKFDMRMYCLIARTQPHLWLFHPGYCKVALDSYDEVDVTNTYAHLTNACVQRAHPQYRENRRGQHIWSEAEAEEEMLNSGRWKEEFGPFWLKIHEEMKKCIGMLYRASVGSLERRTGYFDLLGLDFMLDANLKVHLLEVNSNPAMFFESSPTLQEMVPRLINSTLDMVLEAQRPGAQGPDKYPEPFEVVVDESKEYVYQ